MTGRTHLERGKPEKDAHMPLGQTPLFATPATSGAHVEGPYRYTLWRTWANHERPAVCAWVMLNPSIADAHTDDPTIRRCIAYSRRWGFDGLIVRNLFALRATNPTALLNAADPIGPGNDTWLTQWDDIDRLVVAWGTGRHPRIGDRWRHVAQLLAPHRPTCLRTTRDGQPVHPLYQPAHLDPTPWRALP